MAALDTPWISLMSSPLRSTDDGNSEEHGDPNLPTYATFSPSALGRYPALTKQRSTILVHQKSPLLVATPPQITRALAYSHPFLLPLNKFVGLLTWTSGDPWESFLLLASFWVVTVYGDTLTRWTGPIVLVLGLIFGMYVRRYSPLSSTRWTGEKGQMLRKRGHSEASTRHHKSLDEIVDTLKIFTSRCDILLDPMLRLTDFLSTQRTATSATTKPALTVLFIRILLVTPAWVFLTFPPFYIITTKRVVLTIGTLILTWHSRPARVARTIIWRSRLVRRLCSTITGLRFEDTGFSNKPRALLLQPDANKTIEVPASLLTKRKPDSPGIRFTFTLYENQRRWLGIGWTSSMLAYERAPWTDEHLNPVPPKDKFELPEVEGSHAKWRWVDTGGWYIEGASEDKESGNGNDSSNFEGGRGWVYYDNKWRDGRRGQDGWGRYTRRRKWCRDAELVEASSTEITPTSTPAPETGAKDIAIDDDETPQAQPVEPPSGYLPTFQDNIDTGSMKARKRRWLRRNSRTASERTAESSGSIETDRRSGEDDVHSPLQVRERESEWGLGDDAIMELG